MKLIKKTILITPLAFRLVDIKKFLKNSKKLKLIFVEGPVNNKKKLSKLLSKVDACIIGSEKIDRIVLKDCKNLKIIVRFGTSFDNIDIEECKKKNILLKKLNKNINTAAVARHTLALLLSITNNIKKQNFLHKKNLWEKVL